MKTEIAWAAGFFDGEGCVRINEGVRRATGYAYFSITVTIGQVAQNRDVLDRFHVAVGGLGKVCGPYETNRNNEQGYHQFRAAGPDAVEIMRRILPYLSKRKTQQAEVAIARYSAHKSRPPHPVYGMKGRR